MLFPPTLAGSLPKPGWLAETEKLWPKWRLEGDALAEALRHADAERIQPCTNCGMAPLPRAVAVGKLRALGEGAELARENHAS